jgi:transcriptional regulator with XRE-family HTH domain
MTSKNQRRLGDRIRQLRKQKGLTQDQVAEGAGIDSKSLSRIECNVFNPSIETLEHLAVSLHVQMQDFFIEDTESPKAIRSYLFEVISTATDRELVQIADAVKRAISKGQRRTRIKS